MIKDTDNIELTILTINDYEDLRKTMVSAYPTMPDAIWKKKQIQILIKKFPDGQKL